MKVYFGNDYAGDCEVVAEEKCASCGVDLWWVRLKSGAITAVNSEGKNHWNRWDVCASNFPINEEAEAEAET